MLNGFKEADINRFVDFLNFIANHAKFDGLSVKDQLEFVRLLNHQQQVVLTKMQELIFEEPKLHTPKEDKEPVKKPRTRKAKGASS